MKRIVVLCLTLAVLVTLLATPVSAASRLYNIVETYGTQDYDEINEVLRLVNKERAEAGLDPLVMDAQLVKYAMQRAAEIAVLYSHTRPDDSECFTVLMDDWRYFYVAGENIAAGYQDAAQVMGDDDDPNADGWMNSEDHRENILYADFQSIGIGCFYQDDGTKYWVQILSGAPARDNYNQSGKVDVSDICITVDNDYCYLAMDEIDEYGNMYLYEGVTSSVTLYLFNAGWEYAPPVKLTGGYTIASTTNHITVDQKNYTVTAKQAGNGSLILGFTSGIQYEIPVIIWPKPTISYTIDDDGYTYIEWYDEGDQTALFGKEADEDQWTLLNNVWESVGTFQHIYAQPDGVYTYVLRVWTDYAGWIDVTEPFTVMPHETPVITKLENTGSGIKVSWNAVNGAGKYRVYVKTTGGWKKAGDTTGTSFTYKGVQAGTAYTFTVRCMNAAGTKFTSDYDKTGKTIVYGSLSTPAISQVANTANGVKVTWGAVNGAAKYRLYVKTGNGGWTKVGDTTGTSLTFTKAESGTKYAFTVRCLSADGKAFTSSYDTTGKSITYIAQPQISSVANAANGVKVTWGAVKGASKYRLFVKAGTSGWKAVGDTTGTSMTFTKAASGTKYTFTVRCLSADGKSFTSSYDTTGKSITYVAQPEISSVTNAASGVKITWGAVKGAAKYRVFVKTSSGWQKIGDTTGTSLTYTKAESGTNYTFTVRCLSADGKSFTSTYNTTGKSIIYVAQPEISSVSNAANGVTVTWNAVKGAGKYRVYVKTPGGSWTKIGDTTGTSLTYTKAESGTNYTFTVRSYSADGKSSISSYDTTGKSITYIAQPEIAKLQNTADGIKITWSKVTGAEKYRVFVKTSSGWKKIGDTTGTTLTYKGVKNGTNYTFTVRCMNAGATAYTSSFNTSGKTIKYTK